MKLFTVGPVEMYPETLKIEGTQLPYFRTAEFSGIMKENEEMFLASVNAPEGSCFIGLTCSGTGAMDATVINTLGRGDRALVINGGGFGARFAGICRRYGIETDTYDIPYGEAFDREVFESMCSVRGDGSKAVTDNKASAEVCARRKDEVKNSGRRYTALLVNACETSTGQLYDLEYLGEICRRNGLFFIVDAVSAYLADPIDMTRCGIDVLLTASQKALALSPGAAFVALSERAVSRVMDRDNAGSGSVPMYFDFKSYLLDQKRGQPPYTSAVGIMLAFHDRMSKIVDDRQVKNMCGSNGLVVVKELESDDLVNGNEHGSDADQSVNDKFGSLDGLLPGVRKEIERHAERAQYFRARLKELPVEMPDIPLSNCVTPVVFPEGNAWKVFEYLKDKYDIFLTPSGGELRDRQLRVGHLGNLSLADYDELIGKLEEALINHLVEDR